MTYKIPKNYTYEKVSEADTADWGITLTSPTGIIYNFCVGCQDLRTFDLCGGPGYPQCSAGRKIELNNIAFQEFVYKENKNKLAFIYGELVNDPVIRIETQNQRALTNDDIKEMNEVLSCIVW